MRVGDFAVLFVVFVGAVGVRATAGDAPVLRDWNSAAGARTQLLACDSAVVMLAVEKERDVVTLPDGTVRTTGSSEILARGSNGPAWIRRFADALLPEGREWKRRMRPVSSLDRADRGEAWSVSVTGYVEGKPASHWRVNLLEGWAGEGLGASVVFDFMNSPDSLRAALAAGMRADADASRRLRQIREPDAAIMPLPDRRSR